VSYDPTRELYQEIDAAFAKTMEGQDRCRPADRPVARRLGVQRGPSSTTAGRCRHAGPGYDIDSIAERAHLLPANCRRVCPTTARRTPPTIVFLVRHGNPKHIKDWDDLVSPGVSVIVSNPRPPRRPWSYLAAWGQALKSNNGDDKKAEEFVTRLYRNVPVLDSGAPRHHHVRP